MFLYFIPGRTTGPEVPDKLMQCQFDGLDPIVRPVIANGPGGSAGAILCDKSSADIAGYYPDRQEWAKVNDKLWIGYEKEQRPTPEGLARSKQLNGHPVVIGGQVWSVPVARRWAFDTGSPIWYDTTPKKLHYRDGEWKLADTIDRYARLWQIGEQWFDETCAAAKSETDRKPLLITQAAEMAVEVLSINYRVWHEEIDLLTPLDADTIRGVLNAVIDTQTLTDWFQKKSESLVG
ncbi:MAG: hypothetical protein E6Q97_38840 [Desulfurellales bacterium]|nr:MAG: hypothetical protein E6Q97_38840 [Desulfurellales bacterium]